MEMPILISHHAIKNTSSNLFPFFPVFDTLYFPLILTQFEELTDFLSHLSARESLHLLLYSLSKRSWMVLAWRSWRANSPIADSHDTSSADNASTEKTHLGWEGHMILCTPIWTMPLPLYSKRARQCWTRVLRWKPSRDAGSQAVSFMFIFEFLRRMLIPLAS